MAYASGTGCRSSRRKSPPERPGRRHRRRVCATVRCSPRLLGCGLRRSELAERSRRKHIQHAGQPVVHCRSRRQTPPRSHDSNADMDGKSAIDAWTADGWRRRRAPCSVPASTGAIRSSGDRMSRKGSSGVMLKTLRGGGWPAGYRATRSSPHNGEVCGRAAGGELEQIQLLLGHSSVQTTESFSGRSRIWSTRRTTRSS